MMQQVFINNSFRKRALFDSILSIELGDCKHKIDAHYEWKRPDRILSVGISNPNTIGLWINLNTGKCKSAEKFEFEILYRAYFISAYIRCLDEIRTAAPRSYFSGLALLCAVNILCGGRKSAAFSPAVRKIRQLRPIDVYCAIRALTRATIDRADKLPEDLRAYYNGVLGELLTYSMLPEIGYKGGAPVYSLLYEIRKFRENAARRRCSVREYALFVESGVPELEKMSLRDLATACERTQNAFWGNLVMRLSAHLDEYIDVSEKSDPFLTGCLRRFEEDSLRYYLAVAGKKNALLTDNLAAIKKLSRKTGHAWKAVAVNSGKIHYLQ